MEIFWKYFWKRLENPTSIVSSNSSVTGYPATGLVFSTTIIYTKLENVSFATVILLFTVKKRKKERFQTMGSTFNSKGQLESLTYGALLRILVLCVRKGSALFVRRQITIFLHLEDRTKMENFFELHGDPRPRPRIIYVQPVSEPQYNFINPRKKKGMSPTSSLPSCHEKMPTQSGKTECTPSGSGEFSEMAAVKIQESTSAPVKPANKNTAQRFPKGDE